ncbi:MAG: tetratricopeptide repeat protein [Anaerolineales bacterium]
MNPAPHFIPFVKANIAYWQGYLENLPTGQARTLDADHPNIFRAIQHGLPLPETWAETATLLLTLFPFIDTRGGWQEWQPLFQRALVLCPGSALLLQCKLLNQLGFLLRKGGHIAESLEAHQQAESLARQLGASHELTYAHFGLSGAYWHRRDHAQAEHYGQMALRELNQLGLTGRPVAITHNVLGLIAMARGDYDMAAEKFTYTVMYWREREQAVELGQALKNLGIALQKQKKHQAALTSFMGLST